MGKPKKKETPSMELKVRVDNFVVTRFSNNIIGVYTASGINLAVYAPTEEAFAKVNDMVLHAEEVEVYKSALRNLCLNLLMAHNHVVLETPSLEKIYNVYVEMEEKIKSLLDEAGEANGIEDPTANDSDEDILDEMERAAKIESSSNNK